MAILSNTHFELSIKRRMSLKSHIDRKYHQLCNRNEDVGSNLFGDDVGKRLKDINEINKINKNITSSYGRNSRYRGSFRGRNRFLGRRGYQQRQSYQRVQSRGNRHNGYRKQTQWLQSEKKILKVRNKSSKTKRKSGKLKNFISNWKYLTKNNWIVSTIKGYKIEFDKKPVQEKIPVPIKFNNKEKELIDKEIVDMLVKGAIKESFDESEQFISNIFLVKKKNGKCMPVL